MIRLSFRDKGFVLCVAAGLVCAAVWGRQAVLVPLEKEPHHHLALKNEYVKVYQVEVAPRDAVKMHRHDTDAISLSLSDAQITVHSPGKPDVRQELTAGQIRLQSRGLVHSTSVEGDGPFRNVTVELLLPQTGERNGCAQVMTSQPSNCLGAQVGTLRVGTPQFETDQTYVGLVRVAPHERVVLGDPRRATLIVPVDAGAKRIGKNGAADSLRSGDLVWLDVGNPGEAFLNDGAAEVRLVCFALAQADGATSSRK